ncbi:DUF397 domain-containing protein [Actinoallomurus sp. NBC_01490]|uniref:DUF397 domain-containing protein n=1 Tax=Actinoallomurus sp. NBC_01490 TaxID=2903557 RepID=UPI003FA440D7
MIPQWRKSSRSGGISDQACVEVAWVSETMRLSRGESVPVERPSRLSPSDSPATARG